MDWNVFFSTLSQTCGAVVGIFSAFLITKIIADQAEFSKFKDKAVKLIDESNYLKSQFDHVGFDGINSRDLEKLKSDLFDTIKHLSSEEILDTEISKYCYDHIAQPKFASNEDIAKAIKATVVDIRACQKKREVKAERNRQKRCSEKKLTDYYKANYPNLLLYQSIIGDSSITADIDTSVFMPHSPTAEVINKQFQEDKVTDNIHELILKAKHQMELNRNVLAEQFGLNKASQLINLSLLTVITLFFLGVIYPLSFLPTIPGEAITLSFGAFFDILNSLKGLLLGLLSVSFSGLIVVFWRFNQGLKLNPKQVNLLNDFCKPAGFSIFLKNYFDNKN
ncbi:hypothetical protein [Pseudoalteromonas nigrifaciens]|uniref:hypothetical protein n=1 Tax=Pseudoalteromonas nigrifaciens TaxID=28109 RepID=UPI003FCFD55A